jgi:protein O-mannosyl-transferase
MTRAAADATSEIFAQAGEDSPRESHRRVIAVAAVLLLATFALYARAGRFDTVDLDDYMYLTRAWPVQQGLSWANLKWASTVNIGGNWHPVTMVLELVISSFFGPKAGAFHLTNAVLHSINVALVFVFLRSTTGFTWRAAAVAALWGWHPLRVESVAWISELKDELCGCFCLLCIVAFVVYRQRPSTLRYALVLLTLVLALLSKSMAVTLPFVLLLVDYWPLHHHP